jgi:antitoxin component YwqK of YwqJK toxin-antitoxin module
VAEKKHSDFILSTLNGVYDAYDPYTKVSKQAKFENGIMHGIYREFFDEDRKHPKAEGHYENGAKQGVWTEFDKKGRVESVKIWNKGELLERTMYDDEDDGDAK